MSDWQCPCCGAVFSAYPEYLDRCRHCGEEIIVCPYCGCEMDSSNEYHKCLIP